MAISLGSCAAAKDCTSAEDNDLDLATRLRRLSVTERQAAIKEFMHRLKDERKELWLPASVNLVALDAKEVIPELINLLDDKKTCHAAMRTLGGLGAKEAIPKITTLLNHESYQIRLSAARALGNLNVKEIAIPELIKLLDIEEVCLSAIDALRFLGAKEAIPKIMSLLNDERSQIRLTAACALGDLGAKEVAIPELIKLLNDKSISVRISAISALGNLGAKEAIAELTKLFNDESISVRLAAACTLGDLGARDVAIPELIKLLKTTGERISSSLYISAARALAKLNARESIPELMKLLADERRDVRRAAGDALGQLDDIETIPEPTNHPIDDDSLWAYKKALAINPKDASAYFNMGFIYDERFDDPSKAIACYQKYLELAPNEADSEKVKKWIEKCKERINHPTKPEQPSK